MSAALLPLLPLLLLLGACGRDPILKRAEDLQAGNGGGGGRPGAAGEGGGVPGADGAGQKGPGRPVQPTPGRPDEPPPGSAAQPPPGAGVPGTPAPATPGTVDGPSVTIRGEVKVEDYELGSVRIDVFDGDQRKLDGPRPSVVGVLTLERPGPFEIQVPASAAQIWLGAYIDENLDGRPGPQDPSGWYAGNPVSTAGGASGIVIELIRQPPPPQHGL